MTIIKPGETQFVKIQVFKRKQYHRFQLVHIVLSPPIQGAIVNYQTRSLFASRNKVLMQSAIGIVPCKLRGATINNVTTPVVTERIHLTVVLDSEHFMQYELL